MKNILSTQIYAKIKKFYHREYLNWRKEIKNEVLVLAGIRCVYMFLFLQYPMNNDCCYYVDVNLDGGKKESFVRRGLRIDVKCKSDLR